MIWLGWAINHETEDVVIINGEGRDEVDDANDYNDKFKHWLTKYGSDQKQHDQTSQQVTKITVFLTFIATTNDCMNPVMKTQNF